MEVLYFQSISEEKMEGAIDLKKGYWSLKKGCSEKNRRPYHQKKAIHLAKGVVLQKRGVLVFGHKQKPIKVKKRDLPDP